MTSGVMISAILVGCSNDSATLNDDISLSAVLFKSFYFEATFLVIELNHRH